jgi:guanine deaminase
MYKVITMSIRTSKARRVTDEQHPEFLTVAEGYYLGTTSGHKYFGAGEGFAVGDKLHAVVIDDGDFPEAAHPLNVGERFERAIYMTHRHNIVSVWSDGREVVRR